MIENIDVIDITNDYNYIICCEYHGNFEIQPNLYRNRKNSKTIICPMCNPVGSFSSSGKEIQLINFIKENSDFNISAACYPEGHIESKSLDEDIKHLKNKVDCGAEHLITQLFFDNEDFYNFKEKTIKEGINVPIETGIMPLVKKQQVERMITLTGVKIPAKLSRILAKFSDDPESLMEAGIAYATDQIIDLLSSGVDGIHLYVMNNSYVANKINGNIKDILKGINGKKY